MTAPERGRTGARRKRLALIHVEAFGWVWGAALWRRPAEETEHDGKRIDDDSRAAP
jgi:hypothetical protein